METLIAYTLLRKKKNTEKFQNIENFQVDPSSFTPEQRKIIIIISIIYLVFLILLWFWAIYRLFSFCRWTNNDSLIKFLFALGSLFVPFGTLILLLITFLLKPQCK